MRYARFIPPTNAEYGGGSGMINAWPKPLKKINIAAPPAFSSWFIIREAEAGFQST
ncbi:MAG: hypothetical protein LKJ48_07580 [Lactobacillus sp.]|jgi:hypothetical protein|nr:hypothetical protein [Lactobacillus sp.]